ncbi:TRAP transporter large permease subunit [Cytobacillus pseudoceanisediminis]|uniref:TRAP transporter large permease subunit n=1 Tax=Cytobacillus pseudoceanisediminis TaxID=3051614 RepID=UPI0034E23EE2
MMLPVFFISLFIFIFLSVPIAFSLGLSTALGVWMHDTLPLEIIPQRIFVSMNSFPLMAIPFLFLPEI